MAKVTWILRTGEQRSLDVEDGTTLMQAATFSHIPGISGDCGGEMMCATCHVYVQPPYLEKLGPASEMESDMLDVADAQRRPESRLSCQLVSGPDLDGIMLRIPPV